MFLANQPPSTWQPIVTAISVVVGIGGLLVGALSYRWNRKESRLDSLTHVMTPMIRSMQALAAALNARQVSEQLRKAYPNPEEAPQAVAEVSKRVSEYNDHIALAQQECRTTERELAARQFRFPDRIVRLLRVAKDDLFRAGREINEGRLAEAELRLAVLRDHQSAINKAARGWRLADPLEWLRNRRPQPDGIDESEFDLAQDRMDRIMNLIHRRVTTQTQHSFAIHPPAMLIERPEICEADDAIDQLKDSIFEVVYQDGTYEMLAFHELMVFVHQLLVVSHIGSEVNRRFGQVAGGDFEVSVSQMLDLGEVMRPEVVKLLLSKIAFSSSPSDAQTGNAPVQDQSQG